MPVKHRLRQLAPTALAVVAALALSACGEQYPNSTFNHTTEFNTAIDTLWDKLLFWGTVVFVIVEVILVVTIIRYRRRPGLAEPKHVHGNTAMEIAWTVIPAVILVFIAIPTVRTIFLTQAKAPAGSLEVEVIGHQWWWEFRYPQYGVTTANELYLPKGRTVNFSLKTADVLHSFWIPQLGGKRDLVNQRTNYLWFTPDSALETQVFNGTCNEFCGPSHANMKFRSFVVSPEEFESWARHQKSGAAFGAVQQAGGAVAAPATASLTPVANVQGTAPAVQPPATRDTITALPGVAAPAAPAADSGYIFPADRFPDFARPQTPLPRTLAFDDNLLAQGDAERGRQIYSRSACIGCHVVRGNPSSIGVIGPDITHFGSRHTLAAALYPNDARHLARWIKNSRAMKPGSIMPTLGRGERDPITGQVMSVGSLSDQEIADIVAYLLSLK
jgi:cytochrome c oxidase subunit 2